MPVRFAGGEQAISFNPHYLLDGLAAATLSGHDAEPEEAAAAGAGWIRLEFTSPAKPALITWAGGGEQPATGESASPFRYLVVPLRVPATT